MNSGAAILDNAFIAHLTKPHVAWSSAVIFYGSDKKRVAVFQNSTKILVRK